MPHQPVLDRCLVDQSTQFADIFRRFDVADTEYGLAVLLQFEQADVKQASIAQFKQTILDRFVETCLKSLQVPGIGLETKIAASVERVASL